MENQIMILAIMATYITGLMLWGVYQGRKVKTEQDYAIAGRKLPGWVAALSERATGESSWALLGLPGAAYAFGLTEIWTAVGCVTGIVTAWALLAWRLSDEADKLDAHTFTSFIARSHPDDARWIRMVASSAIVFFFFFYVGAQFLGGGKTLHALFNINPITGMIITAVIIVPYTIYGGFRSVVYTDVVQAIVMIIALIIGPIMGFIYLSQTPGLYASSVSQALEQAGPSFTSFTGAVSGFSIGIVIVGGFSWFFGYLGGQPQLSTRFMAIRDRKQAKQARNIGIGWTLIAYIGALSIGWIGLAIFGPEGSATGLTDREFVMPKVLLTIFPAPLAAVLITGAIAAMISTADSLLILSSTELTENLLKPASKKMQNISNKQQLFISRGITALLAVIALSLALISGDNTFIFSLVSYVWAGIGGTFSVVVLLTLFWKKYHGRAVLATIVTGITFTIIWINTGMEEVITSRLLTFFVALATAIITTYVWPAPKKQVTNI
ncbi:MAG: sodium/proline symporter [Bacteroidetes bacterium]|nr:MAG: sodium/proline symporter [Bacteroidota bacterium]